MLQHTGHNHNYRCTLSVAGSNVLSTQYLQITALYMVT